MATKTAEQKEQQKASKEVPPDQIINMVERLAKDSDAFRQIRNAVYRKVNKREADPKLLEVFHQIIELHGYESAKACWAEIRREQRDGGHNGD